MLARLLFRRRQDGVVLPVADLAGSPADLTAAYAVQDALDGLFRAEAGHRAIGYKIAGTNPASRAHLRIDAPFFGRLYDGMASATPAALAFRPGFLRVHEPEIALQVGRDLPAAEAPFDADAMAAATRAVLPAIEIIGTPLDPWSQAGVANLAADNAAFGHWIMGAPVTDWRGLDLLDGAVTVWIDGQHAATGKGRNVDDGAFGAAAWLANALAGRGVSLKAGDYITTGSVTPPIPVQPGQHVRADFGGLGSVEVQVLDAPGTAS
ncbi:hypothetical protein CKO45_22790 [Paracraurococcus ruber]|uniref:Fumarylacetoacetase-like C-terminal domain-containing protein n=1 Tax=Paracraurococcus ruber TaxID=77675 RepID=A0ABS1D2I4_9PROT|nr:hypothetical protein [Paracraurococcus ruber]